MIRTIIDTEKECIFTLTEKSTLSTPLYWFIITSQQDTANSAAFTLTDNSLYKTRYNSFDVLAGDIYTITPTFILNEGMYNYQIFETTAGTAGTIVGSAVESGLWYIATTETAIPQYNEAVTEYTYNE